MVKNIYKVPKAAWKKFGEAGQLMYNAVRDSSQQDLISPLYTEIPKKYWKVIAHNFAFTAAIETKHLPPPHHLGVGEIKEIKDKPVRVRSLTERHEAAGA